MPGEGMGGRGMARDRDPRLQAQSRTETDQASAQSFLAAMKVRGAGQIQPQPVCAGHRDQRRDPPRREFTDPGEQGGVAFGIAFMHFQPGNHRPRLSQRHAGLETEAPCVLTQTRQHHPLPRSFDGGDSALSPTGRGQAGPCPAGRGAVP